MASSDSPQGISRRQTFTAVAAVGVGLPVLAACGSGSESSSATDPGAAPGATLGPAADVPVGGGTIYADEKVVVTQPVDGQFNAFSAVCTHQSCLVSNVEGGTINCTCHGSKFSIEDGSVVNGPATSPLATVSVKDEGGQLTTS